MLTPRFTVTQTDDNVVITIHIPHVRVSNAEIYAEKNEFTFFCKPYLLKLLLPEEVCDDENCHAAYDPDKENGTIVATLPKRSPGVYFPDLDLTTLLLQNRILKDRSVFSFPSIEIIGESNDADAEDAIEILDAKLTDNGTEIQIQSSKYGFNQKYSGLLSNLRDELADMIRLRDPDNIPVKERRKLRLSTEKTEFDPDRYMGDLMWGSEDGIFIEAMSWEAPWDRQWALWKEFQQEHPDILHTSNLKSTSRKENFGVEQPPQLLESTAPNPQREAWSPAVETSDSTPPDDSTSQVGDKQVIVDTPSHTVESSEQQSTDVVGNATAGVADTAVSVAETAAPWTIQRALARVFEQSGGFTETQQETMRSLPRRCVLDTAL